MQNLYDVIIVIKWTVFSRVGGISGSGDTYYIISNL